MTDIIDRLREPVDFAGCDPLMLEAATEIERLRGDAQPPTKPWVCCNCDADLSCGACGVEQPNDSAYYERIIKENELLTDRLEIAQKIIAEYQAGTIAGAKADVAAHGLPGTRPPNETYRETVRRVAAAREKGYAAARANLQEAWSALAMIRETIETLAPSGSVKGAEHLDGPTFMHEAEALVAGIMALSSVSSTEREGSK